MTAWISRSRLWAIIVKEFIQMRRDRMTFAMMVGIPLIQLVLFGFAINADPKFLPTAIIAAENSSSIRAITAAIQSSGYFRVVQPAASEDQARSLLETGKVLFVVTFPVNFSRDLIRGDRPQILVEADATDPAATSNALGVLQTIVSSALSSERIGALPHLAPDFAPIQIAIHRLYNPEANTQYNIIPGLLGVVLTLTMVIITGLAITRETESGTMENLLSMPTRPAEVMVGKIVPYIIVGYIQVLLILFVAQFLFVVPFRGSLALLLVSVFIFIAANLAVGVTFSTIARNQRQAMQMAIFFFLPSLLLSGFMFPFKGMPTWAQWLGEILPLTHFLRIVRGIMLKGVGVSYLAWESLPILVFLIVVLSLGIRRYRQTLD